MTDFIKQLKEQINIADVVGEYVRLRKTGSNHMGLCPFHAERSPSFSVSERKGIFHCFGCQKSGDAITFMQEIQAISFHDAVRALAARYNIKLPPEFGGGRSGFAKQPSAEDKLEIYYKLNRFVAQFYHEKLLSPAGRGAREYLAKRGVSDETIRSAYLGYAPADWAELYEFLVAKQAPLDKAEELGLIRKKEKGADASGRAHYDLFRDRVIFPVTDLRGRVIAFGGRALGASDGPKYLNSSEGPVYKKGNHLFGLFAAQKDIRAEDLCVVVEGFMDCLMLQQEGIGYAVATLGTALTEKQVAVLKRFTKNIVVLFDGDSAGKEAQTRAMETFLNEDVVVRGVSLPDELDPDEFVRERGADVLSQLLRSAPYVLDQRILELASQAGGHAEARARAVDATLPLIAKISSDTSRLVRIEELSGLFDVKSEALERRVAELRHGAKAPTSKVAAVAKVQPRVVTARPRPAAQSDELDSLDSKLIEMLIVHPGLSVAIENAEPMLAGLETQAAREIIVRLLANESETIGSDILEWSDVSALKKLFARSLVVAEQVSAKERTAEQNDELFRAMRDLEKKLVRRGMERRKASLRAILLKADGSGQTEEFSKLMCEYNELAKKLDETKVTKEVR